MPFVRTDDGARIAWRQDGRPDAPPLLLVNSLGCDLHLWQPVMDRLAERCRVIRFDMRGHGLSDAPEGEYTLARLAQDALAVLDAAGAPRADLVGVSLGGMIGMWLGQHAPARIGRLVLANTSAAIPPQVFADRMTKVREGGMQAVLEPVMERFLSPRHRARGAAFDATLAATLLSLDPAGYAACCAAIRDMDIVGGLPRIAAPTLVVIGAQDPSTPPAMGHAIADAIPGAQRLVLDTAHLSHVERPGAFAAAVLGFLAHDTAPATLAQQYEGGLARRRANLGTAYVDARLSEREPFTAPFQDYITRNAWGTVWTQPLLTDRERRLLVLAMTLAMANWDEFQLHLRAGLQHELDEGELQELLMQAAVYCGVPRANTGFHHAKAALAADTDAAR